MAPASGTDSLSVSLSGGTTPALWVLLVCYSVELWLLFIKHSSLDNTYIFERTV